ncbi:DesA family fatty acid desaturase [Marinicella litoralis]|uniref:Stearoyl-CoA desaturase (Delta-9 desaturase) n=1 Tax=Marinicella litoralis TaxID=644220 RepID=A0A4R6XLT4_9GAMM|nr:fatty acid desaturase [Marinicella litoralis]TDR19299.1 stearoyl-CoA desaturase (delta-9 desaturase) [Marinicella litoralis]
MYPILDFLQKGLLDFSAWQIALYTFIVVQLTLSGVSLYLHREQTHRGIQLNPVIQHFYRFWLWFTTGMLTKDWVAIHRKHHAFCETEDDPHSPQIHGIKKVLFHGVTLYTKERKNQETLDKYGQGTPNDWIERNIYTRFHYLGILLLAALNFSLFGVIGFLIFAIQIIWIPFFAAGVINGLGHFIGYRNYRTDDSSRNITRFAFFVFGEELHNNHHAFPSSCKFSHKKGEHDIGWYVIRLLNKLGLCQIKKVVPDLYVDDLNSEFDTETVRAILTHKFNVLQVYIKDVIKPNLTAEYQNASSTFRKKIKKYTHNLSLDPQFLKADMRNKWNSYFEDSKSLNNLLQFKEELQAIWESNSKSVDEMIADFKAWCQKAEASGNQLLKEFAASLSQYKLQAFTPR